MRFLPLILISAALTGCRSGASSAVRTAERDVKPSLTADAEREIVPVDAASADGSATAGQSEDRLPDAGSEKLTFCSATTDESAPQSDETAPQSDEVIPLAVEAVPLSQDENGEETLLSPVAANSTVDLQQVIVSVHQSFPLVQAAFQERQLANGNRVSAWGEFDTKLKAASENGPLGFYETYRNSAGFTKPIYSGGEFFGGYRNGGGDFEPWYLERETNNGGEFKGGVRVPLIRDRDIDSRRAAVWRATYDQQIADPVIRASLVLFSRDASLAYWKWVAAGQKYRLGQQWLDLAEGRNDQIKRRVELQDLDPPELTDNERAIAKREAKLADSLRVFQQAAVKLSLFLRDESGRPYVPSPDELPEFPLLRLISMAQIDTDISRAQLARPELRALDLNLQQLRVDYAEASNMTLPGLDAQLVGSQDVGEPTSSKRDKSEFELQASLFFDVPLQRRKGRGKMQAVQAKMSQVSAKRRMVQDKVAAEVRSAYAGLIQSRQEVLKAREAVRLASEMADIERRRFEAGESDLLKVALREQYALEAAEEEITATYNHFVEFTEYAATLAIDRPEPEMLEADEP